MNPIAPRIRGDPLDVPSLKSWWRRFIRVFLESSYTADGDAEDVGARCFAEDHSLSPFLEGATSKFLYIHDHLLPFVQRYSEDDCVRMLTCPPQYIQQQTIEFAQKMANGGIRLPTVTESEDGAQTTSEFEERLRATHKAVPSGCRIRTSVITKLNEIPGVKVIASTKGKVSKVDNFNRYIEQFPFLFKRVQLFDQYIKLQIDLAKFETLMTKYGNQHFGRFEDWGQIWGQLDRAQREPELDSDSDTDCVVRGRTQTWETCLDETIDFEKTVKYSTSGADTRQTMLDRYIHRHRKDGKIDGCYSTIKVSYYSLYGIPSRWYGYGPCAQKLSRESRRHCFEDHAVDVDFTNCHSRLFMRDAVRRTGLLNGYQIWHKFNANPDVWKNFLQDYFEIDAGDAKKEVLRIFNTGNQHK